MRIKGLLALAAAAVALVVATPEAAQAFDHDRANPPAGWVGVRNVRHWVYYPRYQHYYLANGTTDPYAYRYQPNGYYPYYNSGYWKPRNCVPLKRAHFAAPKYHQAWGANKKRYNHVKWHDKHHGEHRHHQW